MIPVLVRPKLLSIKNRWRNNFALKSVFGRDLVLAGFSTLVMLSIYWGLMLSLQKIKIAHDVAYLHPSMILGIVFLLLFGLLLFSNSVSALGLLLLGQDLDLVMASPIRPSRFFIGKFAEILASATWMVCVFGLPVIVAFANSYQMPWSFFVEAIVIVTPFFCIPSAIAIIAVLLFTSLIPANRTREILILSGGASVIVLYFAFKLVVPDQGTRIDSINDFLNVLNIIRLPNTSWTPSLWVSVALGERIEPTGKDLAPYIFALYGAALALTSIAYLIVRLFHARAFSMARTSSHGMRINSRQRQLSVNRCFPFLKPQYRALLAKELSVFARDMTQTVQLILLLGLCAVYLYNLKILRVVEELPEEARTWWQAFLIVANVAMGAFVIAAVCTRFVFPSISMEGQAYWILRNSPMKLKDVLRAKFWIWLFPVATIGSVLLTSGAFAIRAEPHVVIASGLISWILCYGIVGLAVGLGAVYANFTWEHSSQLAASFGSLIFMIASTVLIAINTIPTTIIILLRSMRNLEYAISPTEWYICISSCALLLMYLNYFTARWALKLGEASLIERERQ